MSGCFNPLPFYANRALRGLLYAGAKGDGYTVVLEWANAAPDRMEMQVVYNIYYSTLRNDVFNEGVKFVVTNPETVQIGITGLTPGDLYFFAVRAALHDPSIVDLNGLPNAPNGCKLYPDGSLLSDITATDLTIPVMDVDLFTSMGVVQIGAELIHYTNVDIPTSSLIVASDGRGYYGSEARLHTTDGYDGYTEHENPLVRTFIGFEDRNSSVVMEENKAHYPNHSWTEADGYAEINQSTLITDLSASDEELVDFKGFDFAGFRRTDPVALLRGDCVGSYYGGEHFCADGYEGVGRQIRGVSIEDINTQREEVLLSTTGESVVLVKRLWSGKRCSCVSSSRETPEHRCPKCYGTGFVTGYEQFFNPRRSDGRILVRFDPAVEDLIPQDSGLELTYKPNSWTLAYPAVRDRDFLIRFTIDGVESERFEILDVTRNKILLNDFGAQKMSLARIRKTDPIYQWRAIYSTATVPQTIFTSISSVPGLIPPHTHEIVINEGIVSVSQINQTTSVAQGHNHTIFNGDVLSSLDHSHIIILP